MQLALRTNAPDHATALQRASCAVIRARLVSSYCHGGIVVDGVLTHSTSADGLHHLMPGEWTPERWDLIDVGSDRDDAVRTAYVELAGAQYDWLSLLAFVGPRVRDSERLYCFEWCWLAMTGQVPTFRVTPEMLLRQAIQLRGHKWQQNHLPVQQQAA